MQLNQDEISKRIKVALSTIKNTYGAEDGEYSVNLFASHHLNEIEVGYWEKHLGIADIKESQILDILVLRSYWRDDENGIDIFDFTIPENITDYIISVHFNKNGQIEEISMES